MRFSFLVLPALLVLAACAGVKDADDLSQHGAAPVMRTSAVSEEPKVLLSKKFENKAHGYTMSMPPDWTIKPNVAIKTASYSLTGSALVYPAGSGDTLLVEAYLHTARTQKCPVQQPVARINLDAKVFTYNNWEETKDGFRHQYRTYTIERDNRCYVLTSYFRTCKVARNCTEGHTQPVDSEENFALFEEVLRSLQWKK